MATVKPVWQRLYRDPVYIAVARAIGYQGCTVRELGEKITALGKQFDQREVESAIYFFVSFEGQMRCNPPRPEVRKLCIQFLGPPPAHPLHGHLEGPALEPGETLKAWRERVDRMEAEPPDQARASRSRSGVARGGRCRPTIALSALPRRSIMLEEGWRLGEKGRGSGLGHRTAQQMAAQPNGAVGRKGPRIEATQRPELQQVTTKSWIFYPVV
jgi:hypothetical protein